MRRPTVRAALPRAHVLLVLAAACGTPSEEPAAEEGAPVEAVAQSLQLGAYTTPREAYGKAILPAFQAQWKEKTGRTVTFEESYQGSGAQARAVVDGFEADVVALSLDPDMATIEKAGLITSDWRSGPHGGMVSQSVVVIAVRPGNPKGIKDWADLAKDGVSVLTPNVRTSGGAMWNVAAIYGAALRGHAGVAANDAAAAEDLLSKILANVEVMDKGARESMTTFENGVGDAALTYENEVLVARQAGKQMDYVVPHSTIVIENPAAVVDKYVTEHGTMDVAQAFVAYLHTPEAQAAYAKYGLRPVDPSVMPADLPPVSDAFTIRDLGGWDKVLTEVFEKGAAYDRAMAKGAR
jgi:sulfate/thiosulfate transport system substrate-binding protein